VTELKNVFNWKFDGEGLWKSLGSLLLKASTSLKLA